ncbi:hypothetical protein DPM13_01215 [Paracoccus mutanolyticus]|uniref:Uncharacterized protein n=1 Tax=Paracoccus mutanolyticus TaxID=1499308 RepID=A0ABM6WP22_9RHOB|nr:hypothetical protein DPM13_01215 [Paracoccus mutanolyticus]
MLPAAASTIYLIGGAMLLLCMVIEVEGIGAVLDSHPESLRQIAFADRVLTKTDAAPAGDWPEKLKRLNPGAGGFELPAAPAWPW